MKYKIKNIFFWLFAAIALMGMPALVRAEPTCEVKVKDQGPPKIIEFVFLESQVGIKKITIKEYKNVTFQKPTFYPGVTTPITVTVTQTNPNVDFYAVIEATDMNDLETVCQYPGEEPPQCSLIDEDPGPPLTVAFSIVAPTEGLSTISVEEAVNANVDVPAFTVGTTEEVIVSAQQIDTFADFSVSLIASDLNGNQSTCGYDQQAQQDNTDPQIILTSVEPGPPTRLEISAQDNESGIQTINTVEATNADVQISAFSPGTTEPVVITAVQSVADLQFKVEIEVVDRNGNKASYSYETANASFRPEIDLVGQDSDYFFRDDWTSQIFINGTNIFGTRINDFSAFQSESFSTTAGQASVDTCYSTSDREYLSMLTPTWTDAKYEWVIVLQMKPATDLMLKINGCVFKPGEDDIWTDSYQTGFYTLPWAPDEPIFVTRFNPRLTVQALPGPMAKESFSADGFTLDTRSHSGLHVVPLIDSLVTVQNLPGESIVISLPAEGSTNASGQMTHSLSQGDRIKVVISIPGNTTADVRFGASGTALKYIGIGGTEYTTND